MRLETREVNSRISRFWIGAVALLSIVAGITGVGASSPRDRAQEPARPGIRRLDFYTGLEPNRVRSTSTVDRAESKVSLGSVLQGDLVQHRFVIPNPTDEPISVEMPKMCTRCILEGYSKEIRPRMSGEVSLVIPTDDLGGQTLSDRVEIATSRRDLPRMEIEVSLAIRAFAELSRYRVWLEGKTTDEIVESCLVTPSADYPFEITAVRARKGVWFNHSFKKIERDGRTAYQITIRNTRTKPGPYQDVLFVQTDHPERPEFKIRIEGRIQE